MSHALVLLWLGTSTARAAHQPDLDSWQRARQVALQSPAADVPRGLRYDPAVVSRIEKLLDEARIAAGSLDEKTARSRLSAVDRLLYSHPSLPQAAWLMAERLEIEADVFDRRADGMARARALRVRARALEGRRALSYTSVAEAHEVERSSDGVHGAAPSAPRKTPPTSTAHGATAAPPETAPTPAAPGSQASPALVHVTAGGLRHGDELYVDARRVTARLLLAPGEHHARVIRRGRAVWAGWVHVAPGHSTLELPVAAPVACSRDDLAGTHLAGAHVVVPKGVRCRHWAVALPAAHGDGIRVATCHGSSCDPLLGWQRGFGRDFAGPAQAPQHRGWPGWATYLLTGVGVAATTGFILWRTGAFDQPSTPRTVWRYQAPLHF